MPLERQTIVRRTNPEVRDPAKASWDLAYWIWIPTEGDSNIPPDPDDDLRLELLCRSDAFGADIEGLRSQGAPPSGVDQVGASWGVSPRDVAQFVHAEGTNVTLEPTGEKVLVVQRHGMYVLEIPRPITRAREAVVREWLKAERVWTQRGRQRDADKLMEALPWFDRRARGESVRDISADIPHPEYGYQETDVRNGSDRVRREIEALEESAKSRPWSS